MAYTRTYINIYVYYENMYIIYVNYLYVNYICILYIYM